MARTVSKEWNGTQIEVKNTDYRAELVINGRTVDFVEGGYVTSGENDYMHGYDGENHIEIRFRQEKMWNIVKKVDTNLRKMMKV